MALRQRGALRLACSARHSSVAVSLPPPPACVARAETMSVGPRSLGHLCGRRTFACVMWTPSLGGALPRRPWRRALLKVSGESPSTARGWVWKHCIRAPTPRSLSPQLTLHHMTARHPLPQLGTVVAPFFTPHPPRSCPPPTTGRRRTAAVAPRRNGRTLRFCAGYPARLRQQPRRQLGGG